ncbi:putative Extracellular solute-binding protein, family 1 [Candidatus Propionivibrio aalborgensis]|uniref:Putative Extracellular solute-binding protein, family 1 n=1 Tax=Candidatus Propionivibrio aalborgensis TaxID=1860101 RepID=A0A1A8Y184_9RHOO|nr:substrate-binding domain-containing protein [Candidatus Propionivibrio aalborgensis]MBK7565362.1 substrate-binding domain-containing protein [Propionivibrio sp.]SBT10890.1 putative Extracellular solute-binding protein, family 1 [Candidatus Propionivibrio aalborgensis]
MNNPKCFQFNRLVRVLFLSAFFLLAGTAQAEVIRVSGVGLSAPLMQRLAAAYGQKQTIDSVSVVLPPLGSTGSMRAVSNGKLDLAIAGRLPTPEEQAGIGQMVELARTAFGFATSDGNRPNGVTADAVADIYAGRLVRWDDGQPIRLIMRPDRESDTILVRQISAQTDAAMTLAAARKGLLVANNDLDTIKLLESVPGSFGPTATGLARLQGSQIRFLAFDGVLPSARAVAEGKYPLSKPLYAIAARQPSEAVKRFMAFLQSAEAREIMIAADFVPANQ